MRTGTLIIDKSALQSLAHSESRWLMSSYMINLVPVLVIEILGDLTKESVVDAGKDHVRLLAKKFAGGGGVVNVLYRDAALANLLGMSVPMTGQVPVDYGVEVDDPDLGPGMIIDQSPLNNAIMRWAAGRFTEEDRRFSEKWRSGVRGLSISSFETFLRGRSIEIPRPRSDNELSAIVDDVMESPRLQEPWILFLLDELRADSQNKSRVRRRWSESGMNKLSAFAPYAHFCLRALLHVLVLWKHRLTKMEPNNLVDVQYLYYLPFCTVFSSQDRLHARLAPLLMRPDQEFLPARDLKAKMKSENERILAMNAKRAESAESA